MQSVISRDGTRIGYRRSGSGPPLVLVHGTGGTHVRWDPILPLLGEAFSVCAVDRRGRGQSGDSETYAIEREFEDVAAVIDAMPEPSHLLGHSYGGVCSVEAALRTSNLKKLVLYEPPLPLPGFEIQAPGLVDKLTRLLEAGDRELLLETFMTDVVRMPPHDLQLFKGTPAWPARVAAAHTLPRELRAHAAYRIDAPRFDAIKVPTLLLLGGDSPPFFAASILALEKAIPNSKVIILPDQQHMAIDTAPELFARTVIDFLKA